jgi:AcrR family transcriptional regulator
MAHEVGGGPTDQWTARRIELWDQLGVLFLQDGFRNLTIGDLAARLNCSRRTLYSLAENREDLVRGVIGHLFDARTAEAADRVAASDAGVAAVVAHLAAGLLAFDARTVFFDDLAERAATRQLVQAYRYRSRTVLRDIVADGIARGALRPDDPDVVADVLDAAAERLAERRFRDPDELRREDAVATIERLARGWLST